MAKKEKKPKEPEGIPSWLITFSDMMTLMLTFFVLLVSMSVMDQRRKLIVLGSISGTFGVGPGSHSPISTRMRTPVVEAGAMENMSVNDLEPLREMKWEEVDEDLDFASNKFVDVLSIPDDVLFEPGKHRLLSAGKKVLEQALPVLIQVKSPVLLAGHTGLLRDEQGVDFKIENQGNVFDASWKLSFLRVMTVYRFLLESGMPPELLRVEAFGRFHPRFTDKTALGRRRNRRVDLVLDKRNAQWSKYLGIFRKQPEEADSIIYRDFIFELEGRPEQ